jgi:hypothetical protein
MSDLFDPNAIPAIYYGTCAASGDRIEPGDMIVRNDGLSWRHADCATESTSPREPAVCPKCFLAHNGECF